MSAEEQVIELERELQSLRLELEEQRRGAAKLKQELERQRGGETQRQAAAQVEAMLLDAAAPVSQLQMQAHLLKVEAKPVQAGDILAVATRLVRALEDHGLTLEGHVGDTVKYNPNQHELLSVDSAVEGGQQVVIRLVGISYKGKLLRKAGVVAV